MATYIELKQQAEKLLIEAETVRRQECAQVVAEIKAKMSDYGITLEDLGARSTVTGGRRKSTAVAKYRGPNGQYWSGGRGRKPQWVIDALAAGKSIEDFAV